MLVIGYRGNINKSEVIKTLNKHTDFKKDDLKTIVTNIVAGNAVNLPDDFVLREELETLNILLK